MANAKPPQALHPRWVVWATLALALPWLLALAWTGSHLEDEFLSIAHGVAMHQGAVLYRDLFDFTGPSSHRVLAAALSLGGPPLLTAHVANALVLALGLWLLQRSAAARGAGPWAASAAALALVVALARVWPGWSHHWLVWPLALGALHLGAEGLQEASVRPGRWALAGALAAGALLTVQPDGAVVLAAMLGALVLDAGLGPGGWPLAGRRAGLILLGWATVLGCELAWLWHQGALWAAYQDAWLFPLQAYRQAGGMNDLPFASDLPARLLPHTGFPGWHARVGHLLGFYVLVVGAALGALAWGLGMIASGLRRGADRWSPATSALGPWALAAVGFLLVATHGRADLVHVATSAPPALILAAVGASALWRAAAGASWGLMALAACPSLMLAAWTASGAALFVSQWRAEPDRWWQTAPPDAVVQGHPAVSWLRARVSPGDRIAVLPYGGVFHAYVAPQATPWAFMVPPEAGFHSAEDWEAYWRAVAQQRPRFVVVSAWPWGGEAALPVWVRRLPAGYREVARFPAWQANWGVPMHVYARP